MRGVVIGFTTVLLAVTLAAQVAGQYVVDWTQKIGALDGGFVGPIGAVDEFGNGMVSIGDLDGDGVGDLLVSAPGADDSGPDQGAAWILFLDTKGKVKSETKITGGQVGMTLQDGDLFGVGLADLGALNPGAARTFAMSAHMSNSFWIVTVDTSGVATSAKRVAKGEGGFVGGQLENGSHFAVSIASLGVLGTSVHKLVVGDPLAKTLSGDPLSGAVWILGLDSSSQVISESKILNPDANAANFGWAVAHLGDIDGPGGSAAAVAVGAPLAEEGGVDRGAVWIFFFDENGVEMSHVKISDLACPGLTLADQDRFGSALAAAGDLDGNGVEDLFVSALNVSGDGQIWILYLGSSGSVLNCEMIDAATICFDGTVKASDLFGRSLAVISPNPAPGGTGPTLAIGAYNDDDGGTKTGAVWITSLSDCTSASWSTYCVGTSGTGGEPAIALSADPVIGSSTSLLVSNPSGNFTLGAVLYGLSPASFPGLGGTICVLPLANGVVFVPILPGGAVFPFQVPCDTSLCGVSIYVQAAYGDPGGPSGKALTQGLHMTFGL